MRLELADDVCRARSGGRLIQSPCVEGEFPDYRRFLDVEEVRNHAGADASSLARSELLTGGAGTPVGLAVGDGSVRVAGPDDEPIVHVNGEFLLEALERRGGGAVTRSRRADLAAGDTWRQRRSFRAHAGVRAVSSRGCRVSVR